MRQSFDAYEIIIIDDGSYDGSENIEDIRQLNTKVEILKMIEDEKYEAYSVFVSDSFSKFVSTGKNQQFEKLIKERLLVL